MSSLCGLILSPTHQALFIIEKRLDMLLKLLGCVVDVVVCVVEVPCYFGHVAGCVLS